MSVDKVQMAKLVRLMDRISNEGKKSIFETVKQASIHFTISAAKATKPGTKSKPSEMAQKHRFRKVVTISARKQKQSGLNHYYSLTNKKHFVSKFSYTPAKAKKVGLMRVTKFLDAIHRKTGKRLLIPFDPTKGKPSKSDRKIPKAGAAKAGWIGSRNRINGRSAKVGDISDKTSATKIKKRGNNPFIKMTNNVHYVSKSSPNSARIGLRRATNRLRKIELPKLDKKIQKVIT